MTHTYHEALPGFDPRQILHDGCDECERRGVNIERALAYLDDDSFQRAWRRAYDRYGSGGNHDAVGQLSDAETSLLRALWGVQVHLERRGVPTGQVPQRMSERCFVCAEPMDGVTIRSLRVLGGALTVRACGPCVDLPDTQEFVATLITERLMPE